MGGDERMNREWKPGTVAMVTGPEGTRRAVRRGGVWINLDREGYVIDAYAETVRPLVVIDPEDREAVERLAECASRLPGVYTSASTRLQAALREFANPKVEVFRHYVSSKDGGLQTAHCGKVWRANAEANVVNRGDCPVCVALVAKGWSL
jgi:hypothetical protein